MKNKENGITLIALVVTIVVLIILAGVSISSLFGESGLITKATAAKEWSKIGEWQDILELEKGEILINNLGEVTIEEYIEHLKDKGIIEDKDIEEIDENNKYITVDDKYVFIIEEIDNKNVEITYMGNPETLPPNITKLEMINTTNSITVKVEGNRLEGGKYKYYIKETSDGEYGEKGTNETGEYTYTELTQNKIYYIKVEVETENGTDSKEGNQTTNTLENLTEANTKFTTTPEGWTNENVNTTVETTVSGYEIEYSKDLEKWEKYEGLIESDENESIYVRITDGYNVGGFIEHKIENIDKGIPKDAGISFEGAGTSTTIPQLSATVSLTDSESGVDITNSKWVINNTAGALGTEPEKYTETFKTNNENISIQLSAEGNYYLHVLTKDNAGNYRETVSKVVTLVANRHTHTGSASTGGGCYVKIPHTVTKECGLTADMRREGDQWDTGSCMAGGVAGTCARGHRVTGQVTWGYGTSWDGTVKGTCHAQYTETTYTYELGCGMGENQLLNYTITY